MGNVITGTDLEIDVGKNYKGKLNIYGKTEQKTRSGKNIVDINSRVCSNISVVEIKGSTITLTQPNTGGVSRCVIPLVLQPNTQYILTAKVKVVKNTSEGNSSIGIRTGSGSGNWIKSATLDTSNREEQVINLSFNSGEYTNPYLWLYVNSSSTEETEIERIVSYSEVMVRLASTDNTYEEYGASPTPEFPSEIENVEGKNLYEIKDTTNRGIEGSLLSSGYLKVNGTPTGSYSDCTLANTRNLLAGNYSISITSPQTFNVDLRVTYEDNTNDTFTVNIGQTSKTITTTKNIVSYRVLISGLTTGTAINSSFGFMLEKGTVATEYVPYNSLAVKVTGKNILINTWKIVSEAQYTKSFGEFKVLVPNVATTYIYGASNNYIGQIIPEGTYTFSFNGSNFTNVYMQYLDSNGNLQNWNNGTSITITNDITLVAIRCNSVALQTGTYNWEAQIEKGIVATAYEPYKSQAVYFPLAEGQKLYEGSYLADDGVHNVRGQVDLSTLTWETYATDKYRTSDLASLVKRPANNNIAIIGVATKYKIVYAAKSYVDGDLGINANGLLTVYDSTGTPSGILEYELAEEGTVPYTEEQQEAWNEIQNIYLFEGKNYFNNLNAVKPKLNLTYLKIVEDDTDFYISENGRLVIPEYDISYLIDFNASNIPSMPEAMEAVVKVVGKDGDIHLNTTYEAMSFSIVCYTDDNLTPEEKVREEQKVNRFMNSIKNDTKILGFETENKFYDVKYSGALTTIRFPAHLQFTIPIKSSESYAKDLIKKSIKGNGFENSETIKDVGATFTIKGPAQTPKISFNNYEIFYDNVLLENTELVIDSSNSTVTHINNVTRLKTNAMRYYNHQFPKVRYGENVLSVNSGIDDESQVKVEWNDLKL